MMSTSENRWNFAKFWVGESVSQTGNTLTILVMPVVAVQALSAGAFGVALLMAAQWTPCFLFSVPVGAWVDRQPSKRHILLWSNLLSFVALGSIPLAYYLGRLTILQLYVVAFVLGVTGTTFQVSLAAFLRTIVEPSGIAKAFARLQLSSSLARVLGPGLAGLLLVGLSGPPILLLDAASFLVSFTMLTRVRVLREDARTSVASTSIIAMIRAGSSTLFGNVSLRTLTIAAAIANLAISGIGALEVTYLVGNLKVPSSTVGGIVAIGAAGGVVGALLTVRAIRRFGSTAIAWMPLVISAPFGLLLVWPYQNLSSLMFAAGLLSLEFGITMSTIAALTLRQELTPDEMLGRVSGLMRLIQFSTIPIGAVAAGTLASVVGTRDALLICALFNLLPGVYLWRSHNDLSVKMPEDRESMTAAR